MRSVALEPGNIGREIGEITGLAVFFGDGAANSLVLLLAAAKAQRGTVLVVDGGNRFDPYLLSDLARLSGVDPDLFLSRFLVSRAFTCHQLHRLVQMGLPDALGEHAPSVVVGLAIDATFHDEMVPLREAARLWRAVLEGLLRASALVPVLISSEPQRPRPSLLRDLLRRADFRFRLERKDGEILIAREHPAPGIWVWSREEPGSCAAGAGGRNARGAGGP